MEPLTVHRGVVAPLNRTNVDTDQIVPKQFLKRVERTGYGQFLFFDWRLVAGKPNPDFVLNDPRYTDASILLAGDNFGSGSSREHAPWALLDYGFRVVVAPSFADIFFNNAFKNGLLLVTLDHETVADLFERVESQTGYELEVDLRQCRLTGTDGFETEFHLDESRRQALLKGLDDIALTLQHEGKIDAYEAAHQPLH